MGAATAAAGENNALTGAIGAGGAEAAAPYVSNWLYGEKDGSKLTAAQKETVSSILSLGGAAVGTLGGSTADAVAGSQAARNAVENNYLSLQDISNLRLELRRARTNQEKERIIEKYRKKGEAQSQALKEACRGKGDECHLNAIAKLRNVNQTAEAMTNNGLFLNLSKAGKDELAAWGLALDSNTPDLAYHEGQLSGSAKLLDTAVKLSPIVGAAASAEGSKAVQAWTRRKVPVVQHNRLPLGVDNSSATPKKSFDADVIISNITGEGYSHFNNKQFYGKQTTQKELA